MFEFDVIQCGMLILFLMVLGEIVSHRMKAAIPAILVSACFIWGLSGPGFSRIRLCRHLDSLI